MNQENYKFMGLDESVSDEELKAKYHEMKKKFSEDRWLDGEAGNEAAKNLNRLENAYMDIMAERREKMRSERSENEKENVLKKVAEDIKNGDLISAQQKLDDCNERNAEWHYYQSVLYYRKNWMNESKKQLEIALQMEPNNGKYREALARLSERMNYTARSAYNNQNTSSIHPESNEQMGGSVCSQCLECCALNLCLNCMCNLCCGCR